MNDQPKIIYWKLAVTVALTGYYIYYATSDPTHTYANWNLIDGADLIIHEAGHVIFSFFGEFIHVLGGSLMQVLIPSIFVFYFFLRREYFSASVLLFWVAQNILYVATYMGDAIVQQLPLLGGDGVMHDWTYLLTQTGFLQYTDVFSQATRILGMLIIICATILCLWFSAEKTVKDTVL